MFKKVLVAEDMDSINKAVRETLQQLGVEEIVHAQYCDEALLKAKKAAFDGEPFELLISDLSFKEDHRTQTLNSGQELIAAIREEFPTTKVIVNSIEDHPQTVRDLWESGNIHAYVCKDRNGLTELAEAVTAVYQGDGYNSPQIEAGLQQQNVFTLPEYEINLLSLLANGYTQDQIMLMFKEKGIKPHSKSSIEKRLRDIREDFSANTTPHLISILKDLRLI